MRRQDMIYSPHQLAYFAHKLTLRGPADSMDRMAGALLDAQVDLNPHQIDAALFATSNPLARGVILADEVGLGKTIEAGLLIAQRWAERRRRILVITPANLDADAINSRFPNLTVKKIPKLLLQKCEWGHDDYSLNVENLPAAASPEPRTRAQPASANTNAATPGGKQAALFDDRGG
jgi:SNF2-related domain